MQPNTLNAALRSSTGKGAARKLRAAGRIPATVYGGGGDPVALDLDPDDITNLRRASLGWNTPLGIVVDGGDDVPLAMLRDVQKHPLNGSVLHVDFQRIDETTKVNVKVRLDLEGKAAGAALGGLVSRPTRFVTVACLPKDIPEAIVIDITEMLIGDSVMIDELPVGDGVDVLFKERVPVVAVVGRRGGGLPEDDDEEGEGEEGAEAEGEGEGEEAAE